MTKWEKNTLWITPDSEEHLNNLLENGGGMDQYNAAMLMWNYCAEKHNKEIEFTEEKI
tara:strand:+ start:854 stop:1027 length:174 start_codon:yes stop_codon:yes gene_type:complete